MLLTVHKMTGYLKGWDALKVLFKELLKILLTCVIVI